MKNPAATTIVKPKTAKARVAKPKAGAPTRAEPTVAQPKVVKVSQARKLLEADILAAAKRLFAQRGFGGGQDVGL